MYIENNKIKLSLDKRDNLLPYNNKFYQIDFLKEEGRYIHGANGVVFKLSDEQENQDFVIKILKFSEQSKYNDRRISKKIKRFEREIEALYVAKENEIENVIQIEFNDYHNIDGFDFQYYVMQKCDCTLNTFLQNNNFDIIQKTILCYKILSGIKGLNDYKIYHRDIKHDNIYFIGKEPYIGDLGLVDYRDSDIIINEKGELIGPTGWFSPEAINKYLVENTENINRFDCAIDAKSEIFQLGKLFWYIYQGNIPIGQITQRDFIPQNDKLFDIIFKMLLYSKQNRIDSDTVYSEISSFLQTN